MIIVIILSLPDNSPILESDNILDPIILDDTYKGSNKLLMAAIKNIILELLLQEK